jgi:hypothetical protein
MMQGMELAQSAHGMANAAGCSHALVCTHQASCNRSRSCSGMHGTSPVCALYHSSWVNRQVGSGTPVNALHAQRSVYTYTTAP